MIVDGGGGQDAAIYARYFLALQVKRDVLRIVDVYVCQRDVDQTVFIFGSGCVQHRDFAVVAYPGFVTDQVHRQECSILMHFVHFKYMISRCQ